MPEYDGVWKMILSLLFKHVLMFYRPAEAKKVNWKVNIVALESEIHKIIYSGASGVKRIDKFLEVELLSGDKRYYHSEIQCWKETDFPHRVRVYNDVAEHYCENPVDSLIILGDDAPDWRPGDYTTVLACSRKSFTFAALKLLDWLGKEEKLLKHRNPFALCIAAHNLVRVTLEDEEARAAWKLRLLQRACQIKMDLDDDVERPALIRAIDWMLPLPKERNDPIWQQIRLSLEGSPMTFVSWFDQQVLDGEARGKAEGLQRGIEATLELRFQAEGTALAALAQKQTDLDWLNRFLLATANPRVTLDELREMLPAVAEPPAPVPESSTKPKKKPRSRNG